MSLVKRVPVVSYNRDVFISWNIIEHHVLTFHDEKNTRSNVIAEIKYLRLLLFDVTRYSVDYDNYVFLKQWDIEKLIKCIWKLLFLTCICQLKLEKHCFSVSREELDLNIRVSILDLGTTIFIKGYSLCQRAPRTILGIGGDTTEIYQSCIQL